jgi:hypothetical protein
MDRNMQDFKLPDYLTWNDYLDFYEAYLNTCLDDINPLDGAFSFPDGSEISHAKLMQGLQRRFTIRGVYNENP